MQAPLFSFLEGLGGTELLLVMFIALLLFGGKSLPQFARGLGKSIREFKRATGEVEREIRRAIEEESSEDKPKIVVDPARSMGASAAAKEAPAAGISGASVSASEQPQKAP